MGRAFCYTQPMAKRITDPANPDYPAGKEFNYEAWNADTTLTLCNVPWNNDYRDVVGGFADDAALNAYIDALPNTTRTAIAGSSYARVGYPVKVQMSFNQAYRYNYLRASNPVQPISGGDIQQDYYYFILDVRYHSPGSTELVIELDVWQTFIRRMELSRCYVERSHLAIAASNSFDRYGRTYLTAPEPMDMGGEMTPVLTYRENVADLVGDEDNEHCIYIVSTVELDGNYGDRLAPINTAASGGVFSQIDIGVNLYVVQTNNGTYSVNDLYTDLKDFPWISNSVISLTAGPNPKRYLPNFVFLPNQPTPVPVQRFVNKRIIMGSAWRDDARNYIPERYRHLNKFLTFPFTSIEFTNWAGEQTSYKPELWWRDNFAFVESFLPIPPNDRLMFIPLAYNGTLENTLDPENGEGWDASLAIRNLPRLPATADNAGLAYASQANSIAQQKTAAQWGQTRALAGNANSYDNSMLSAGYGLAQNANTQAGQTNSLNSQNAYNVQRMGVNALASVGGGALGGLTGGPGGAAIGTVGGAASALGNALATSMSNEQATAQLAIAQRTSQNSANMAYEESTTISGNNRGLADWAARGDYAQSIAAIDAKVQDLELTPPAMVGQFGGDLMTLINDRFGVACRVRMLTSGPMRRIGEYWLRYGYSLNMFSSIPSDFACMSKFTYWKLSETYIVNSSAPEFFKQAIRGIFEKGVTVWVNPDDIGKIDIADNVPLNGIEIG